MESSDQDLRQGLIKMESSDQDGLQATKTNKSDSIRV